MKGKSLKIEVPGEIKFLGNFQPIERNSHNWGEVLDPWWEISHKRCEFSPLRKGRSLIT